MGVRPLKEVTKEESAQYLLQNGILENRILEANPCKYNKLIFSKKYDTTHYQNTNWYIQNHTQPMQTICYINETKTPVFAFFNCIAETKNINQFTWNKYGELESFPPKDYVSTKWVDTLFTFDEIANTIHIFGTEHIAELNSDDKKYTVLVFYSLFTRKQTNNLIKETKAYLEKYMTSDYGVYYINFDNFLNSVNISNK